MLLVVLVASVVFGEPGGGHGSEEVRRTDQQGGRLTTEQSGRQHKSLSSHTPAFDQVQNAQSSNKPTSKCKNLLSDCPGSEFLGPNMYNFT